MRSQTARSSRMRARSGINRRLSWSAPEPNVPNKKARLLEWSAGFFDRLPTSELEKPANLKGDGGLFIVPKNRALSRSLEVVAEAEVHEVRLGGELTVIGDRPFTDPRVGPERGLTDGIIDVVEEDMGVDDQEVEAPEASRHAARHADAARDEEVDVRIALADTVALVPSAGAEREPSGKDIHIAAKAQNVLVLPLLLNADIVRDVRLKSAGDGHLRRRVRAHGHRMRRDHIFVDAIIELVGEVELDIEPLRAEAISDLADDALAAIEPIVHTEVQPAGLPGTEARSVKDDPFHHGDIALGIAQKIAGLQLECTARVDVLRPLKARHHIEALHGRRIDRDVDARDEEILHLQRRHHVHADIFVAAEGLRRGLIADDGHTPAKSHTDAERLVDLIGEADRGEELEVIDRRGHITRRRGAVRIVGVARADVADRIA